MGKFRILVIAVVVVGVGGCASSDGFMGLASRGYVDRQLSTADERTQQELQEANAKVVALTERVDGYGDVREQVDFLLAELQRNQEATRELKELAQMVERRLDTIPGETLRQLVIIIQDYLDQDRPYNAPPEDLRESADLSIPRAVNP